MFKLERLQKLAACRALGYVLHVAFTPKELSIITDTTTDHIHVFLRCREKPNPKNPHEYKDWVLYEKLYTVCVLVTSLLRFVVADKNEDASRGIKRFLVETKGFRNMKEEPPWYPLRKLPGREYPVWQPKNLREFLLEGRMVAVESALRWLKTFSNKRPE